MRKAIAVVALAALLSPAAALAGPDSHARGIYVEARSAQVFVGGCIWNSEAVTIGREAVLAWRIEEGALDGVQVDGLAVVAAIAGDANLAMVPDAPRRTVLFVDERASEAQRQALAAFYTSRNEQLFGDVVEVVAAPIAFDASAHGYRIVAGDVVELDAETLHMDHTKLESCGEMQWYEPFVSLEAASLGRANAHAYRGTSLDTRWSDPDKQSAFLGRFVY